MAVNSNQKGKRGEREWVAECRDAGFTARRGQQYSGGDDSPDVICEEIDNWFHFEVKRVEKLNIETAMAQSRQDAGKKEPLVVHKRNFKPWLVTMPATTFWKLLRGDFEVKPKTCHCDMKTKTTGDGCAVCNPELAEDLEG